MRILTDLNHELHHLPDTARVRDFVNVGMNHLTNRWGEAELLADVMLTVALCWAARVEDSQP
jgi:hypothetical protein